MRKKIIPFALAVISALSMISCSNSNSGGEDNGQKNIATNEAIFAKMQANYYWTIPTNINNTLDPKDYFNALLDQKDKYTISGTQYNYSRIYANSNNTSTSKYDIGFEYGINSYQNGMYYVIYYVKAGTDAATQGLKRGHLIESVNGVAINATNKDYLLTQAYNSGNTVVLNVLDPWTSNAAKFTVAPTLRNADYVENPILVSTQLTEKTGTNKIAYIAYNAFVSGNNNTYDDQLNRNISSFAGIGIEYLVLDLRYNANGQAESAQKLGAALVQAASENSPFIYFKARQDKKNVAYNFKPTAGLSFASNLKKIYIIIGKNTGGMSEVFINALQAYRGTDIVLVGEPTQGRNIATGVTSLEDKSYSMTIAIGEWANKDLVTFTSIAPTSGFSVVESAKLEPLGSASEVVLAKILADITGTKSVRSSEFSSVRVLGSSLDAKATDPRLNSLDLN